MIAKRVFEVLVPPSSGERFPALDGLRGLAVLFVVGDHLDQIAGMRWLRVNGIIGVCVFFALSAFLLYRPWCKSPPERSAIRRYYSRRFWRIVPAYAIFLVFGGLIALWMQQPDNVVTLTSVLSHIAFVHTWFGHPVQRSLVPPAWSLPAEVQFYALLPLFAWLFSRRPLPCLGAGIVAFGAVQWIAPWHPPFLDFFHPFRQNWPFLALPFLMGMLAAYQASRQRALPQASAALGLAALLALAWFVEDLEGRFAAHRVVAFPLLNECGLVASWIIFTVILGAVSHPEGMVSRALAWRPLRCVGIGGYGTFLVHFPLMLALSRLLGNVPCALIAPPLSIALGIASYVYLEAPAMRFARRRAGR